MSKLSGFTAFALGVILTFCITLVGLVVGVLYQDRMYADQIYPGIAIDGISQQGKTTKIAKDYYQSLNDRLSEVEMEVFYANAPVATYSGEMLFLHSNGMELVDQAYKIARAGSTMHNFLDKFAILTRTRRYSFTSHLKYDLDPIQETLLILEKQYNKDPKNALFTIKDGKVSAFAQEKDGLRVNTEDGLRQVRSILTSDMLRTIVTEQKPLRINVTSSVLKPEVTLGRANTLGIREIIGVGTSDYSGSIPERVHNLLLASDRLNGTLVPKDDVFSYNKTVGDISAATGYKPAYVILNGRTVLGDGGGVCQTSTTMFRAALNSGLPIVAWAPHAYRVHYYENDGTPGRDATVYAPTTDFRFKNDTPASILILTQADTEKNLLTYTFWGTKDNRVISISDVGMGASIPAPEPKEQEDPTLPKGERRQVDWAASGLTAWFDYRVTRGQELIQEKRFVSNYRPWQAVYLVGTKE